MLSTDQTRKKINKKKEEEENNKKQNKNKNQKQRKTNYSFSNHCLFYLRWPDHVISYIRSG